MKNDEDFYGAAAQELLSHQVNQALFAKAFALALGDAEKTKALYIGMRSDQLKEGAVVEIAAAAQRAREAQRFAVLRHKQEEEARSLCERRQKEKEAAEKKRAEEEESMLAGRAWERSSRIDAGWSTTQPAAAPQVAPPARPAIPGKVVPPESIAPSDPPVPLEERIAAMEKAMEVSKWRPFPK
jgi:hypothetical protein